jgi:acetyltransferase-like isoleucine patch superfamily enzyme
VKLYDHDHKFGGKPFKISKHEFVVQNITIGSNVWIGSGTIILKGTNIKNNVVIGAGSIISGIIPENTIVIQKRKKVISKLG